MTQALARQLGPPLLGQWFADDTSAVISTSTWRRLGGGRDIIGSAITLNERQHTITGVMPPTFPFPLAALGGTRSDAEVWIPLDPFPPNANRGSSPYIRTPRRKPGISLNGAGRRQARRRDRRPEGPDPLSVLHGGRGRPESGDDRDGRNGRPSPADDPARRRRPPVDHYLRQRGQHAARSSDRPAREMSIRVALGASRWQIALRYFAEGALVSVAGAAAGVGLSVILVRYILAAASAFIPRVDDIAIDWTVIGFSVAVAVATGVLAGLAPLWQAIRQSLEHGAVRGRARVSRRAGAAPVEGVRRGRNRPRLHAPHDVGHPRRPPA